jgi:hypothetical protein
MTQTDRTKTAENRLLRHGIILIVVLHLALVSIHIRQPWVGADAFNGAFWSNVAHNYVKYGFLKTKFGQVTNYEYEVVKDSSGFRYYQNHPPLWPWILGVAFKVLGEGELQARLVSILFSAAGVFLLYKLLDGLYGRAAALIAAFLYATLPVTAFYGHHPNHEPLTVAFVLAVVLLYERWVRRGTTANFVLLIVVYLTAMITDWPAYLLSVLLPVHHLIARRRIGRTWLFPVISVTVLCLHFGHSFFLRPDSFRYAFDFLLGYMGVLGHAKNTQLHIPLAFSAGQYLRVVSNKLAVLLTLPALLAALFGLIPLLRDIKAGGQSRASALTVAVPSVLAMSWVLIFWGQHFITNNWLYYLALPVSILCAMAARYFGRTDVRELWSPTSPAVVFLCVLIFTNSFVNLKEIHTQQYHLLPPPKKNLEPVSFLPELASLVRKQTEPADVVFTDLPFGPAAEAFSYYSQRQTVWGVTDMDGIEKGVADLKPSQRMVLLIWTDSGDGLFQDVSARYTAQEVAIDGQKFLLARINKGA